MTPQRDCDLRVNEGTALDNFILTIFKFPIAGPISWILGPNCGDQSDSAPAPSPPPGPPPADPWSHFPKRKCGKSPQKCEKTSSRMWEEMWVGINLLPILQ